MKPFMGQNFLLNNDTAKALYHQIAADLPIIDYHCHVPPQDIAEDRQFANLTELWLGGDHYKWRAMRSCGVDEKYITGDSTDFEKFMAYAKIMPSLIGNPLYHWTHLELQRYFDCDLILSEETAEEIWNLTTARLADPSMSVRNLIKKSRVEILCTTDDPADTLEYHKALAELVKSNQTSSPSHAEPRAEDDSFTTQVLPAFRPDKAFNIDKAGVADYYKKLGEAAGIEITDLAGLKEALIRRIDFFDSMGCRTSDHALDGFDLFVKPDEKAVNEALTAALTSGQNVSHEAVCMVKAEILSFLAGEYAKRGWVMQLHMGVYRNANSNMFAKMGPDTGYDGIGNTDIPAVIGLLDYMESGSGLPRTIVYSIDPTCDAALGAMIGAFQTSGDGYPKVMQGSAWWFNDTLNGMRQQMSTLASLSAFGKFPGMLTDSRSFTSYPRHEYFRRILCGLIGEWVEDGLYPCNTEALAQIVADICYNNTKNFFGFRPVQ
ncbi:MAG: glucuronate isomerase [Clostridia bacterium]|nr:glucuronate isomerase [Clostridia bacterium]